MDTNETKKAREVAERVIEALGGPATVARLANVTMSAVSQWKLNGIPKLRLELFEAKFPSLDWCSLKGEDKKPKGKYSPERRKKERREGERRKGSCKE